MVKETSTRDRDREGTVKKKRKTNNEETEVDVYKKVVDKEEKEALGRSTDVDAKLYFDACNEIRKLLSEIATEKKNKTAESSKRINEAATEIGIQIVLLKRLNRMAKVRLVADKDTILTEKQKVDSINLNYQNLLYEVHHLLSEANKCFQFKSKDEDIELVPVAEFFRSAPPEVVQKFEHLEKSENVQDHELRLARLAWELQERKNLSTLCGTLKEQKTQLAKDIVQLKNKLDGLGPKLNAVIESTKPLQEHLNIPTDRIRGEHEQANLLPDPLYLFYVNINAFKQVFDINISVIISGAMEEAQQWKQTEISSDEEEEEEEDEEEEKEDEEMETADNERDSGKEVTKKLQKHRHSKSERIDPKEEKKIKITELHPLRVEVTVPVESHVLTMKFGYCPKFNIITVTSSSRIPEHITSSTAREILMGESVLSELVKGDYGLQCPNPQSLYLLKKYDLGSYEALVPKIGYAYVWAQKVCGLDFLTKEKMKKDVSLKLCQMSVENSMREIQKRVLTRYDLAVIFQKLENNLIPEVPAEANCPKTHISAISKWSSITYQQFCQSNPCIELFNEDLIQPSDLFYLVHISRGDAMLKARIVLKHDFPSSPPVFCLSLSYKGNNYDSGNSDEIRDMERAVNVGWNYDSTGVCWNLATQIHHLCAFLDIYLETDSIEPLPQSVVFFKNVCGRNRRRPFTYKNVGSGIFIQY